MYSRNSPALDFERRPAEADSFDIFPNIVTNCLCSIERIHKLSSVIVVGRKWNLRYKNRSGTKQRPNHKRRFGAVRFVCGCAGARKIWQKCINRLKREHIGRMRSRTKKMKIVMCSTANAFYHYRYNLLTHAFSLEPRRLLAAYAQCFASCRT